MNTDQGFELLPGAAQDITEIWEFIAEDSPASDKRVREEFMDSIRRLVPFPRQRHVRSDITSHPLRFQVVRDFPIAYAPYEDPIVVIAVFHGRRSPRAMDAILRGRKIAPLGSICWTPMMAFPFGCIMSA
jgi:plasmid stabilization system protein ParE